jgi:TonB family protein
LRKVGERRGQIENLLRADLESSFVARMSERQKIFFAVIASLVLHVVIAESFAFWRWIHPRSMVTETSQPEPEQLEVTLISAPTPPPLDTAAPGPKPIPKVIRSTLDTDGLQSSETPPENAAFESDKNSRAASELPATGNLPLPSQEGRELPFTQFSNQNYSLGKGDHPAPEMEIAKATVPTPEPMRKPELSTSPAPEESQPTPTPFPLSKPTPVPTPTPEPTPTPPEDSIALGKPTPVPTSTPAPAFKTTRDTSRPISTPSQQLAKLISPPPARTQPEMLRPSEPGYQPQHERTKIDGGITNRGKPGVDAVASPIGRYKKSVADAIGSRWYHYVDQFKDMITVGEVHVRFYLTPEGRVENAKIISNTSNASFGNLCVRAVLEAQIPVMPDELAPALNDGRLEIDYNFLTYPQ